MDGGWSTPATSERRREASELGEKGSPVMGFGRGFDRRATRRLGESGARAITAGRGLGHTVHGGGHCRRLGHTLSGEDMAQLRKIGCA